MNTNVDIILGECESIISETENVNQFLIDDEIDGVNTFDLNELEIDTIRLQQVKL